MDMDKMILRNVLRIERYQAIANATSNNDYKGHLMYEVYLCKRRLSYWMIKDKEETNQGD